MPSYVLNPVLDEVLFEDVLCKKLLSLDLRDPTKSLLSVMPIGYKKVESPCPLSLGGTGLSVDSRDAATLASGHWGQHEEQPCSPLSRWNKTSFWTERSLSMVEAGAGALRWSSSAGEGSQNSPCRQPVDLPPGVSAQSSSSSSSSSSSRYKTELCRTFAESGTCKYGSKCQFAHGAEELRDLSRHPKYKTEPCRTFHTIGYCPYGIRCHFVHNNEDDLGPSSSSTGSCQQSLPRSASSSSRRPPLLRQSVSFSGFPSAAPDPSPLHLPFLRAPSVSPPASADVPELLSLGVFDPVPDSRLQFRASRDPGCSFCRRGPPCAAQVHPEGEGCRRLQQRPGQQSLVGSCELGSRSLSYTSLSDHEGGSGSSASSLSGSESSVFEGAGRRLPIFSQLSVPDDSVGGAGCGFFI